MSDKLLHEAKVREVLEKAILNRAEAQKNHRQFDKAQEAKDISSILSHFSFEECVADIPEEVEELTQRISLAVLQYNLPNKFQEGQWYKTLTGDTTSTPDTPGGAWAGEIKPVEGSGSFIVDLNVPSWDSRIQLTANTEEAAMTVRDYFLSQAYDLAVLRTQQEEMKNYKSGAELTIETQEKELAKEIARANTAEQKVQTLTNQRTNLKTLNMVDLNTLYAQVIAEISARVLEDPSKMVNGGVIQINGRT